jgi:4-hydroxy-tetrahydrodipicolinate synthase
MDLTGIGGIWPASLTPFDKAGAIDDAALHAHIAELAGTNGVRAVVVNGHAGETASLTRAERAHVIGTAKAATGGKAGVVAGIVADDTRGAVALARDAAQAGADALLLFPPALFAQGANARPEMASRFLAEVAQAAGLPIVLFQLSLGSGLGFSHEVLLRLCRENESIIAIKEGSDTPQAYEDNLTALRGLDRQVMVLTTNNSWLMASLAYGGDGILSGIGSVASPILAEIFEAMVRGDLDAARRANARLRPLCRAFYRAPHLDAHNRMKTALHLLGKLPNPDPRTPLLPIEAEERAAIAQALAGAGLMPGRAAAA